MNRTAAALSILAALALAACGDDGTTSGATSDEPDTVTLVAYDSFPAPDPENPIHAALADFTVETGIGVEILIAGDTGTMLSKAALTAGNPEGDVMWGIDNTFLSRAVEADVFESYTAAGVSELPADFTALVPNGEATPVDFGDVCVNYDIAALESEGLSPPGSLWQNGCARCLYLPVCARDSVATEFLRVTAKPPTPC